MPTSDLLHVAFIWHMHQPYYRSARTGAFTMPWVRMHALKDYLDMVETLGDYPRLHQTFNLVPSLVEQLEDYASGHFEDTYWRHTLTPAQELTPAERGFVVERMCDHSGHPRPRAHPRYLELSLKRETHACHGWVECARAFSDNELRDLQVWFNLAWFDPHALGNSPLRELVVRGRDFAEDDKRTLAEAQRDLLVHTLPAYREAAARGQVELSTSPYFHPILPLLCNSDSMRVAAPDAPLPRRRFAHPEDAREQIRLAIAKHEQVFGSRPLGMWCSEQAVGEDVIPMLLDEGISWTVSDESVLARSFGATQTVDRPHDPYAAYRLEREGRTMAMVFRDHTLSDLIGFAYQSWNSKEAAQDLLRRLREIRRHLLPASSSPEVRGRGSDTVPSRAPLVTIALDGENAWEYYPADGRDFLRYLYEGLDQDEAIRCVTVSEHLGQTAPERDLDWLHTGSWIGADLRTWSGGRSHHVAWNLLHQARDLVASRRDEMLSESAPKASAKASAGAPATGAIDEAWRNVLIAEGSDWFWWFGEHHHTDLDHVWDANYRFRLGEIYRLLGHTPPPDLLYPLLSPDATAPSRLPQREITVTVDGLVGHEAAGGATEWDGAGYLIAGPGKTISTMQQAAGSFVREVRYGFCANILYLLVVPDAPSMLEGLELELGVARGESIDLVLRFRLESGGRAQVDCEPPNECAGQVRVTWQEVMEASVPLSQAADGLEHVDLMLHVWRARCAGTDEYYYSRATEPTTLDL